MKRKWRRAFPKPRRARFKTEIAVEEGRALFELDEAMRESLKAAARMGLAYERVLGIRRALAKRAREQLARAVAAKKRGSS